MITNKMNLSKLNYYWRRISQSEIRNSAAAEKRGRAKIPSPQPPSFLPARAIGFQNLQSGFSSKKVRILTKRYRILSKSHFGEEGERFAPYSFSPLVGFSVHLSGFRKHSTRLRISHASEIVRLLPSLKLYSLCSLIFGG